MGALRRDGFASALAHWVALLGDEYVIQEPGVLDEAGTATMATRASVLAILRPANRDEVQQCLRIAHQHHVPIYPVSSGKNWGYGSSAPTSDAVLLHLGRLNRIIDYHRDLAYVTIEPGVTQEQLYAFLQAQGGHLWMDATGASPSCSVIGNTLERGFGHTPMGDHCGNACNFEVVLPTGTCVETGFGRFEAAATAPLHRMGVGPSMDGLLAQSNFGVVTRMTVWLMPAPEAFQAFFFQCADEAAIGPIVDALRPLRLDGTLRSVIHVGNDYKVLAAASGYPWTETDGVTPLPAEVIARLRARMGFGVWNGSGGLYGTPAQVREARRRVKRALRGLTRRLHFVDDRWLGVARRFARPFRLLTGWDVTRTMRVIEPVYGLLKGIPTATPLASAYWRKRGEVPAQMNPDRDGCGLLWCSPVVPNTSAAVLEVTQLSARMLLEAGFEPQMSISLATERTAICVTTISYDRDVPGEDQRASACYRALVRELLRRGFPPYRVNIETMDCLEGDGDVDALWQALKRTVDPHMVLAPGRYEREPVAVARSGQHVA